MEEFADVDGSTSDKFCRSSISLLCRLYLAELSTIFTQMLPPTSADQILFFLTSKRHTRTPAVDSFLKRPIKLPS